MANLSLGRPAGATLRLPALLARSAARVQARLTSGEPAVVLGLLAIALLAHGFNMFNYPAFTLQDDEGIYASQAWAVLRLGQLSPYTYFYDHAPAGWLLYAVWMAITGGPVTFGGAIESGRVLMLLLHLAMVPLLYHVSRKLGVDARLAVVAGLLFSLSPLAVFYQRLVLLDTIMLFWVLLSLDLLLDGWGRLSRLIISGACFGLAVLSKETAVVLTPALLFLAVQQRWRHHGGFAVLGWLVPMLAVVSFYPVYAALKGELLPTGSAQFSISGYAASSVSLVDALLWQATRDGGGLLNGDNQFWRLVRLDWAPRDPVLFVGGAVASVLNVARGLRDRRALAVGLLGLLPLVYLGRGGVVFPYYILIAVPFFALNLALLLTPPLRRLPERAGFGVAGAAAVALLAVYWQSGGLEPLYIDRPAGAGREAVTWIKQHVPADSAIVARDDLWPALREPGQGGPAFERVYSHWKVAGDPAIRSGALGEDWRRVDYLILSPDLDADFFATANNPLAGTALQNAHLVKTWEAGASAEERHPRQVIQLWKVDKAGPTEATLLREGATAIKRRFERNGAYPEASGIVTSEAQSYALLRAVWTDDRAAFNRAWSWTQAHLQHSDGLLAWKWQDGAIIDPNSATDADTDVALALLLGARRWEDPALLESGTQLVRAIWEREVALVGGAPHVTAGPWATEGPVLALNPSYFAPYAYRIFQEVDPEHDWLGAIDAGYRTLFAASREPLGAERSAGLPPNWVGLERATGSLVALPREAGEDTTRYSYDAARTYWRVALDLRWSGDGRADAYLRQAGFLRDEVNLVLDDGRTRKGAVSAAYAHDGAVVEEQPSAVGTAGATAALLTLDPPSAHTLHASALVGGATRGEAGVYWDNPDDLYAQEWAWFALALYADAAPNLWAR